MSDPPEPGQTDAAVGADDGVHAPSPPHLTERERAIRAGVAGVVLGLFLRLVSRRRSA